MLAPEASPGENESTGEEDASLMAFLERKRSERLSRPFTPEIERRLKVCDPNLRKELIEILRTPADVPDAIDFDSSADGTKLIAVNCVVDARRICLQSGCEVTGIVSLTTPSAVDTLLGQLQSTWSGARALMVVSVLQRLLTVLTGSGSPYIAAAISRLAPLPPRNLDHRVFPPTEYRKSAIAIWQIAALFAAAGKSTRARTLRLDAGLLALGSSVHPRLSEYCNLNTGQVKQRIDKDGTKVVTVALNMKKTQTSRMKSIYDPQICKILLALAKGPPDTPVFRNWRGGRLLKTSLCAALARGGRFAVGEAASANILRKSRTLGPGSEMDCARDLGQIGPETAERKYKPDLIHAGTRSVREASAAARKRIADARTRMHDAEK